MTVVLFSQLIITMDKFYDPDNPDTDEKYAAVDKYEYAITDNSLMGHLYTNWTALTVSAGSTVSIHNEFEGVIPLFDLEYFIKNSLKELFPFLTWNIS